jgi:hypothetical protein
VKSGVGLRVLLLGTRSGIAYLQKFFFRIKKSKGSAEADLGNVAGGLDYAAVSKVLARFDHRLSPDPALHEQSRAIQSQLSK